MAAGPNVLRGSGPNPKHAFEDALTQAGSPDLFRFAQERHSEIEGIAVALRPGRVGPFGVAPSASDGEIELHQEVAAANLIIDLFDPRPSGIRAPRSRPRRRSITYATAMIWMLALNFEAAAQSEPYLKDVPSPGEPAPSASRYHDLSSRRQTKTGNGIY
jgi:hypothetical protein